MIPGTYRIAKAGGRNGSATTNTPPVGAYRGAGRPEACAHVERLVELAADELDVDPLELRRRNLVPPDAFPYRSATGMPYDAGDYRGCLDAAAEHLGYHALRAEQAERRAQGSGVALGVAVTMWIDCTPMNRPGEWAAVDVRPHPTDPDGIEVSVRDGANDQGQAHRTTWGILLSHTLGVPLEHVHLVLGDTAQVPHGEGTGSARSLMLAGGAVAQAGERILQQGRAVAAHLLEAAPADIAVTSDGRLGVVGSPQRSVSWGDVARAAADPASLPGDVAAVLGDAGALGAEIDFTQPGPTFPSGAHGAVVEVDLDTGKVTLVRFVAVDDCGTVINPVVVEGQQQGGIVQGIGQALYEGCVYDSESGQLITGSYMDYCMPRADDVPFVQVGMTCTPSPSNPLGVKGCGEAGAIAAPAAVMNAVTDALGVKDLPMPATPEKVWRALQQTGITRPAAAE
jgi:carbon-monoxide dehydrogenase large subunit